MQYRLHASERIEWHKNGRKEQGRVKTREKRYLNNTFPLKNELVFSIIELPVDYRFVFIHLSWVVAKALPFHRLLLYFKMTDLI